jgi:glycosyltransferase involved in cell wall biosynthesis
MLSIVIPLYNESESVEALHREICEVAAAHGYELDVLFVDDGSKDGSWDVVRRLADGDPRVRGIRFRRNFGKAAALSAGFAAARGEVVMTMDADLQDDPREIPRFLAALDNNLDVVSGWKQVRHDPWHKVMPSRVFNEMVSRLTGVNLHDHNCGMKCYRRTVLDEVRLYGELHRFIPVIAASRGFRVGEIVINHRPRKYGQSKYGFTRFVKGFLDLLTVKFLTSYGRRPQHVIGTVGLSCAVLGTVWTLWIALRWLLSSSAVLGAGLLFSIGLLLAGIQLISMGLLAELFMAYREPDQKPYAISDQTPAREQPIK